MLRRTRLILVALPVTEEKVRLHDGNFDRGSNLSLSGRAKSRQLKKSQISAAGQKFFIPSHILQ